MNSQAIQTMKFLTTEQDFIYMSNGTFAIMDKADRVQFELAYNLIVDIHNRDLDADMATALRVLTTQLSSYWLTSILLPHR